MSIQIFLMSWFHHKYIDAQPPAGAVMFMINRGFTTNLVPVASLPLAQRKFSDMVLFLFVFILFKWASNGICYKLVLRKQFDALLVK